LLRKPESGFCLTQPESGSKKSKIQSMHTSGAHDVKSEISLDSGSTPILEIH